MEKLKRLIISCGGTGGHFFPGLSIARTFHQQGGEVLLLLGGIHADKQAEIASGYGVDCVKISAVAIPRNPLRWISFLRTTWKGVCQCRDAFRHFDPQGILCMGSFASLPPTLSAKLFGRPLFLHDGNARLGKANKTMSWFARRLALSFPAVNASEAHCEKVVTGMPLRPELLEGQLSKEDAIKEINRRWEQQFTADAPMVLVFGGSLGAKAINENFRPDVTMEGIERLQVIHLTGPGKRCEVEDHYKGVTYRVLLLESSSEMQLFYSAADIVISRSGGSTVSELAFFGKYAVLIPYPYAAEHHQDDNARWLVNAGGAVMFDNAECSPKRFNALLSDFLVNIESYRTAGENSKKIAMPHASQNVLEMIDSAL